MPPRTVGRDLTTGPLARNLFAVAWPVMISSLLQTLYNLADSFWLGKLGKAALVAPTVTMQISFLAFAFAMGLGLGGSTLVSQYKGAGRPREMARAGGQTLVLLTAVGFGLGLIGLVLARPLLVALQTPADAFDGSLVFLRWIMIGVPFTFIFFVYSGISRRVGGHARPAADQSDRGRAQRRARPDLIFGLGPVPRFGSRARRSRPVSARASRRVSGSGVSSARITDSGCIATTCAGTAPCRRGFSKSASRCRWGRRAPRSASP